MKHILLFLMLTTFVFACKHSHNHKHDGEAQGKEYTSAYICPMHCEGSGSDKPGICPVCSMDYEKNESTEKGNHKHEHEGHDHDNHTHDDHHHLPAQGAKTEKSDSQMNPRGTPHVDEAKRGAMDQ